jgi:hypothetical protein
LFRSTSVAVTVKLNNPAAFGVPLISPLTGETDSPGGSVPPEDQMQTKVHPLADRECEYGELTVQSGKLTGEIVMATAQLVAQKNKAHIAAGRISRCIVCEPNEGAGRPVCRN